MSDIIIKENNIVDVIAKLLFIIGLLIVMFSYGMITERYHIFPYYIIQHGLRQIKSYFEESKPTFLWPLTYNDSGVKIYNNDNIAPGVTLITSYWEDTGWSPGIRLIDRNGNILYHWDIVPENIWPDSPYTDHVKNTKNTISNCVHGSFLYPNGDIVFNVEYLGLVKMNSQSEILWKLPYRTSHSVFMDEEGYFWVCGTKWIESEKDAVRFPGLTIPFTEDIILKVSPDGNIIKEISVLEQLYIGDYQHLLYHNSRLTGDVLHLNDIEVLSAEMAIQYADFESGDIIVSMRDISSIAVLDQEGNLKWICPGVFTKQHDPDFEADGSITVYDNRARLGTSKIRRIYPLNNKTETIFPANENQKFYSMVGGKHQLLENGNRLITETCTGRILEVSENGEIVWEWYQKPYNQESVVEVFEGTRYNLTKEDIMMWNN